MYILPLNSKLNWDFLKRRRDFYANIIFQSKPQSRGQDRLIRASACPEVHQMCTLCTNIEVEATGGEGIEVLCL